MGVGIGVSSIGGSGHGPHLGATLPQRNDGGCEARGKSIASINLLVDGGDISVAWSPS